MDVGGGLPFFFCFCGNGPCNHREPIYSFKTYKCPSCSQNTIQQRQTDNCLKLFFCIPICPVDTGEPYYQCTNPACNAQLPLHPIGRPVTASAGPPIALSSPAGISNAPYSIRQPQQPVQPYQQPIGELYKKVNDSNIYPGQQHAGYIYGNSTQQQPTRQWPPTYGSGRVGGDDNDGPDGRPAGGNRGFRLSSDQPQKGTVVSSMSNGNEPTVQKGTTVQLPTVNNTINSNKQPSAPDSSNQTDTMKQASAPNE